MWGVGVVTWCLLLWCSETLHCGLESSELCVASLPRSRVLQLFCVRLRGGGVHEAISPVTWEAKVMPHLALSSEGPTVLSKA